METYLQYSANNQAKVKTYPNKLTHHTIDAAFWTDRLHLNNFDMERPITRKELSVFFVYYGKPFGDFGIDIYGNNKK